MSAHLQSVLPSLWPAVSFIIYMMFGESAAGRIYVLHHSSSVYTLGFTTGDDHKNMGQLQPAVQPADLRMSGTAGIRGM
jgi:hypothetical protein